MIILGKFFLFLNKNIFCGYSLEVPRQDASNEYPKHTFLRSNNMQRMTSSVDHKMLHVIVIKCYCSV